MVKKLVVIGLFLFVFVTSVMAQKRMISGTITDEMKLGMPSVTIVVENTDNKYATTTNLEGKFKFDIPIDKNVIIVSFVGYKTQKINVEGLNELTIQMEPLVQEIEGVVVSALGISREKKSLGYSIQNVDGSSLSQANETNIVNSLSGKVAGLQVSSSATGPGGSSQVIIRGASSLSGNNQPLFVIDGVPVNNSSFGGGNKDGGIDYGNAVANINAEDIESVSVLKGGNAAALYGSMGQNGVILITTKKGILKSGLGINYGVSYVMDQPYIFPEYQNTYSRGSQGVFVSESNSSWGEKMKGQQVVDWKNHSISLTPFGNQAKEFFKTSFTLTNDLSIESGFDKGAIRASVSHSKNDNIIPNSKFEKLSITIRANTKLGKNLNIDAKINLIQQDAYNRPNLGGSPDNPMRSMYIIPRDVRLNDLKPYRDEAGFPILWDNSISSFNSQNPYWSVYLNTNSDSRTRTIGFVSATYDFTSWLNLMVRSGVDMYFDNRTLRTEENTAYKSSPDATYRQDNFHMLETNNDFLLKANRRIRDFSLIGSFGGSIFYRKQNGLSTQGAGQINPGKWYINNFKNVTTSEILSEKEVQSLYGFVSIGYKDQLYLDLTARNDWSSALTYSDGSGKNSYFYSSASFSWLISETFKLPSIFNIAKFRASYAEVGNDTDPNRLEKVYATSVGHLGQNYTVLPTTNPPFHLVPERTQTMESGIEIAMLNNRIGIDLSAYRMGTKNQIFSARVAPSSGYTYALVNSGLIDNRGVEAQLRITPIQGSITWKVAINFSKNWSKVKEMAPEVNVLSLGGDESVTIMAMLNQPNGNIVGKRFWRDGQGRLILDFNGLPEPEKDKNGNPVDAVLGNINPDWLGGISNNLTWKNFDFSILIDTKWGGEIYSLSNAYGSRFGTTKNTVPGRDAWYSSEQDRITLGIPQNLWTPTGGLKMVGVDINGNSVSKFVNPQAYWNKVAGDNIITEAFIYDATFVRLKELSLGYNIPIKSIKKMDIRQIRISIVGKNLMYLYKKTPGFIPESAYNSGIAAQGIEKFAFPAYRSLGFKVSINF